MRTMGLSILAVFLLLGPAYAATQNASLLWYEPKDSAMGIPSVTLENEQKTAVTIRGLELKVYSNTTLQTIKIKQPVTIPVKDPDGYRGWIPIQMEGVSNDFLNKGRWNVTRIEAYGYLYAEGSDPYDNEYRPKELIDRWWVDTEAMQNLTQYNDTIFRGIYYNKEMDYAA